jgi:hypothetical protein
MNAGMPDFLEQGPNLFQAIWRYLNFYLLIDPIAA